MVAVASMAAGAYGYYLLRPVEAKHTASTETANPQPHSVHESPAASAETLEFPQDRWQSAGIKIQPVKTAAMTEAIELTGKIALNEDRLAHIFPLVEGRVDEVKIRFGQRVQQGELLVVVQSQEVGQGMLQLYQNRQKLAFARDKHAWTEDVNKNAQSMIELMRQRTAIEEIEATLKERTLGQHREKLMSAYILLQKTQAAVERLAPLSPGGAVPARQILEAEAEHNAARAALLSLLEQTMQDAAQASKLAAQDVLELQTRIAVSETNLKILGFRDEDLVQIEPGKRGEELAHYPVTAPFHGTVITKDVVLLERVGPEEPILTIADLSTVWVTADIYETHLPLLSRLSDQVVRVRCDAWPDQQFEARIFYTGDVVQESTRTIALRAVANNTDGRLKPGMFVRVELPSLDSQRVIQVPVAAIQDHAGQSFVFIHTGGNSFQKSPVVSGRHNQDVVEIVSGLQGDEQVVVDGGFALKSQLLADLLAE